MGKKANIISFSKVKKQRDELKNLDDLLDEMENSEDDFTDEEDDYTNLIELDEMASGPPVSVTDAILIKAIKLRAQNVISYLSDGFIIIDFKSDNSLIENMKIAKFRNTGLISSLKIRSGLDISERNKVQKGSIDFNRKGFEPCKIEVTIIPNAGYEIFKLKIDC